MPKVAILMTYHNDHHPELAFESALNQTFQDFEIIVATSQVESLKIPNDKRIKVIEIESETCYGKWNAMARLSNSEFNAFLPCDDVWIIDKLETQLNVIGNHAECVSNVFHVDENLKHFISERVIGLEDVTQLSQAGFDNRFKRGNLIYNSSVMYRSSIHDDIGYWDESLSNLSDLDFHIRANRHSGIKVIDRCLAYSHNDNKNITFLRETFRKQIQIIQKRYY